MMAPCSRCDGSGSIASGACPNCDGIGKVAQRSQRVLPSNSGGAVYFRGALITKHAKPKDAKR